MFGAAVSKFTEAVGSESNLIPVPDLDSAGNCETLQVVIKENKKWFWQSPSYEPATDISLNELITDMKPFTGVKQETQVLEKDYNKTHKVSLKSEVGGKLVSDMGLGVKELGYISLKAHFGQIDKDVVDQYELMKALKYRKLDLNNTYLKQVRQNKRNVLCVVVETAKIAQGDGTLKESKKLDVGEGIGGGSTAHITIGASAGEGIDSTDEGINSITIPAGTRLAYKVCELLVQPDGALELVINSDCEGGFKDASGGTSIMGFGPGYRDIQWSYIRDSMNCLDRDLDTRRKLISDTLTMCTSYPHDVHATLKLLRDTYSLANGKECIPVEEIEKSFNSTQEYQSVLEPAGFVITEGLLSYPKQRTPELETISYLFLALDELDDDTLTALGQLDEEYVNPIRILVCNTINGKLNCTTDVEVHTIYEGDNSGRHLADSLGFTVEGDTQQITPSGKCLCRLNAAHRALFALWHETDDVESKDPTGCTLL